eukprot:TRINITY_DN39413_c0_g1_i1.p1 TRINITY_DN39413_c0_g1~~TRINITY_DN39413_c0_g1_i1.p1  ORF type:complete len:707 (+),score=215.72 TRINITY_DN39413_c0_g1_i1:231-2351(+)
MRLASRRRVAHVQAWFPLLVLAAVVGADRGEDDAGQSVALAVGSEAGPDRPHHRHQAEERRAAEEDNGDDGSAPVVEHRRHRKRHGRPAEGAAEDGLETPPRRHARHARRTPEARVREQAEEDNAEEDDDERNEDYIREKRPHKHHKEHRRAITEERDKDVEDDAGDQEPPRKEEDGDADRVSDADRGPVEASDDRDRGASSGSEDARPAARDDAAPQEAEEPVEQPEPDKHNIVKKWLETGPHSKAAKEVLEPKAKKAHKQQEATEAAPEAQGKHKHHHHHHPAAAAPDVAEPDAAAPDAAAMPTPDAADEKDAVTERKSKPAKSEHEIEEDEKEEKLKEEKKKALEAEEKSLPTRHFAVRDGKTVSSWWSWIMYPLTLLTGRKGSQGSQSDGSAHVLPHQELKQVLMILDMQRDYDSEECRQIYDKVPLDSNDLASAVPTINNIRNSREWDQVIFTQDMYVDDTILPGMPRAFCVRGTPGVEIMPGLETKKEDLIYTKTADDAFNTLVDATTKWPRFGLEDEGLRVGARNNRLRSILEHLELGPTQAQLTLVGRMLDRDILKTAMHAYALGYHVAVVWDAVALTTGERPDQSWEVPSPSEIGKLNWNEESSREWLYLIAASHYAAGTAFAYGYMEQAGIPLLSLQSGVFTQLRDRLSPWVVDLCLAFIFISAVALLVALVCCHGFRRKCAQLLSKANGNGQAEK